MTVTQSWHQTALYRFLRVVFLALLIALTARLASEVQAETEPNDSPGLANKLTMNANGLAWTEGRIAPRSDLGNRGQCAFPFILNSACDVRGQGSFCIQLRLTARWMHGCSCRTKLAL